jgi:hypothetical protein
MEDFNKLHGFQKVNVLDDFLLTENRRDLLYGFGGMQRSALRP